MNAGITIGAAGPVDLGQVTRCTAGATVATLICFAQLGMLAAMLLLRHREWGWFAVAALLSCLLIVLAPVIDLRSRRRARDRQTGPIPPDVLKAAQERFATEGTPRPAVGVRRTSGGAVAPGDRAAVAVPVRADDQVVAVAQYGDPGEGVT